MQIALRQIVKYHYPGLIPSRYLRLTCCNDIDSKLRSFGTLYAPSGDMFRIDEIFPDANTVVMQIEGSIDRDAIESLKEICKKYLHTKHIKISLDLESLLHINKEGKAFLEEIRGEVGFSNVPEFLKLELGLDEG